ncbi:hypothetical protein M0Q97_08125 [Candidatus Dojkabacteria bacterium]|jgi:predicted nucleotidyltransferase|nr:hypothetical protein [Candidatus Dojkabacteria bacterium]
MTKAEEICTALNIDYNQVLNIFSYGSVVYGCNDEDSDEDFIIVYKSSLLPSGAFKDNAISSLDKNIQAVCYSRSGFIDAINNYEICALECLFLPEEKIIQKKWNFGITKWDNKEFVKKIITKASSSWYFSTLADKQGNTTEVMINIYHALRILKFGIQIKKNNKIVDYSSCNKLRDEIYNNYEIRPKEYYKYFLKLQTILKK